MSRRHSVRALLLPAAALLVLVALVGAGCSQSTASPAPSPTQAAPAAQPTAAKPAPSAQPSAKVDYPTKPLTIVIPFDAGGGLDLGARLLAVFMEKELKQPIEIVNRPGATGQVGLTSVIQSKADGYTIGGVASPDFQVTYLDTKRNAPYKRDSFAYIANQVIDPNVIAVNASSPYKTLKDLVDAAKAKPSTIASGDSGVGSDDHISLLTFAQKAGVKFAETHYTGGAAAQKDLLGGHIDFVIDNTGSVVGPVKSGQMRVLAVAADKRSPLLSDVPTYQEQGYEVVTAVSRGFVVPAATPAEVVQLLEATVKKIDAMPEYQDKMSSPGLPRYFLGSADYGKQMEDQEKRVSGLLDMIREASKS